MLQIVRPDIVVPLAEYRPTPVLSAALRAARLQRVEKHEERLPAGREGPGAGTPAAIRAYGAAAAREEVLRAGRFMSQPVRTLPLEASAGAAREVFLESGFQHLPLLDRAGRVAGMLSERDLLRAGAAARGGASRVADIATREVLVCSPETPIGDVGAAMLEHHFGGVPVVDAALRVLGILTHSDILRLLLLHAPHGLEA